MMVEESNEKAFSKANITFNGVMLPITNGLMAGAVAGAITKTSAAPLERVVLLYQTQGMLAQHKYTSITQTLRRIVQEESFTGLFRGNTSNIIRACAVYGTKFGVNDACKNYFREADGSLTFRNVVLSAAAAGFVQKTVTFPLDMIALRIAMGINTAAISSAKPYTGMWDCASRIVRNEGIAGLYKGLNLTIATGTVYVVMQLTLYDYCHRFIKQSSTVLLGHSSKSADFVVPFVAGATTALISKSIMYPGDTLRKRLMVNGIDGTKPMYSGYMDCLRQMVRKEGVLALFAGIKPSALKSVVNGAIQFGSFEACKELLKKWQQR